MNKFILFLLCAGCSGLFFSCPLAAQTASDVVVPVTVTTGTNPPSITLSFPATTNAISTLVGKKQLYQTAWSYAVLPANATSVTDTNVMDGVGYEYMVIKQTSTAPTARYGLVYTGIELPPTVYRGKVILVVDDLLSKPLTTELDRLVQDLRGDGWQVVRHDITIASSTVSSVKTLLRTDYLADPDRTIGAFLIGNIPVPYSGDIAPDGHGDHKGAWPTDYYYADMDEAAWTDNVVNDNLATRPANRNVPGDGKFDQSLTPTPPEIIVSRLDFSNLSGWDVSQTELYRRYLNKNHAFRTGAYRPDDKTLVDDNFGYFGGEAFAQSGWANGYALTGTNSVVETDFFNGTETQSYLVGYGCGDGTYTSAAGVGSSADFMTDSVNITFAMLFGSYHGDWDYETNPFMPSALASKGGILTCAWAGRPNWFFHQMGLGQPILVSTLWTWFNTFISPPPYPPNLAADLIHVGMLGDPTLRAHAVKPPTDVVAKADCIQAQLSWTASDDADIIGYAIYWAPSPDSVYQFIDFVTDSLNYTDIGVIPGLNYYQVKALKLQITPTGSYYNQSLGIPAVADLTPQPFSVDIKPKNISCNGGNDGSIELTVTIGDPQQLTFQWSNGSSDQSPVGLTAGTYTVTISTNSGCSATSSIVLSEPTALQAQMIIKNETCFGLTDGALNLTVSGGLQPYSIAWSNGKNGGSNGNLAPGTYTATVTDNNGCTLTSSATVTGSPELLLDISATDATCNAANDGVISATLSGGTPGYSYLWSNGATTLNLTNIAAGTYTLTATDANGCSKTASATVQSPPAIIASTAVTNAGCAGATNGAVDLTVSGGTPGYSFLWSNGATTQDLADITSGTYTVTITDGIGCTKTTTATVGQTTTLVAQADAINISCFGASDGIAILTASGGEPDYSYLWSNGQSTASISNLPPGTYTATLTDNVGCSATASATVTQPDALLATGIWTAKACAQDLGDVDLTVSGGTPGYFFFWSNGASTQNLTGVPPGVYTVTVADMLGCTTSSSNIIVEPPPALIAHLEFSQTGCTGTTPLLGNLSSGVIGGTPPYQYLWSNGATTETQTDVPLDNYTLIVTDALGCTLEDTDLLVLTYEPWVVDNTVTSVSCFGGNTGSIILDVTGANGPGYTYLWSNGSATKNIQNLTAGTYTVTVTDESGCTTTSTAVVTQPGVISLSTNISNESCPGSADGGASVAATGGTPPFTFAWSNGQTTATATNLSAGTYTCTVADANACQQPVSVQITVPAPSGATITGQDTACVDLPELYTLSGIFSNYQWTASGVGLISQGQGTNTVSVLWAMPGAYTLNVYFTNASNCPDSAALDLFVDVCVGTNQPALPGIRVLPNPFGDWLAVQVDRPVQPGTRLRLTDMQGRLIMEQVLVRGDMRLETAFLPAGAYLLHIVEGNGSGVWKVIKTD